VTTPSRERHQGGELGDDGKHWPVGVTLYGAPEIGQTA